MGSMRQGPATSASPAVGGSSRSARRPRKAGVKALGSWESVETVLPCEKLFISPPMGLWAVRLGASFHLASGPSAKLPTAFAALLHLDSLDQLQVPRSLDLGVSPGASSVCSIDQVKMRRQGGGIHCF